MKESTHSKKQFIISYSLLYIGLIIVSIFLICLKGISHIDSIYIVNITVDIFGMLVGYILFISYDVDVQKTGNTSRFFLYLLHTTFIALFTDMGAWLLQGEPELVWLNLIDNTIYYLCMPTVCYFFWRYLRVYFRVKNHTTAVVEKIMFVGLILALLAILINMFTGIYFTVDAAGFYVRSKWYILSMLYAFVTSLISGTIIIIFREKLAQHQIVSLILFVLTPTAAGIFTIATYGLSVCYGIIMVVMLMMYCFLNIEESRDRALVARELTLAKSIQANSLPNEFPPFPDRHEFDLYASMDPAKAIGGDFYDFYLIDEDHLYLAIADVSGKGIPAALFMMSAKTILFNNAMALHSPAEILRKTNEIICSNNKEEMFVTVWIGILEISSGKLTAANAGHEYPVLKKSDGEFEIIKDRHGFVIGGMNGVKYKEYELQLEPGSKLFVYSDGLPEATDLKNNMFSINRMLQSLNRHREGTPKEILDGVREDVNKFVAGASQFDDLTMLCLEIKSM